VRCANEGHGQNLEEVFRKGAAMNEKSNVIGAEGLVRMVHHEMLKVGVLMTSPIFAIAVEHNSDLRVALANMMDACQRVEAARNACITSEHITFPENDPG
jgi:hypothetical protein